MEFFLLTVVFHCRPIEQHQAIMEVNGFSQSDEAVAPIQCSKMSLPTSSPIAKSRYVTPVLTVGC